MIFVKNEIFTCLRWNLRKCKISPANCCQKPPVSPTTSSRPLTCHLLCMNKPTGNKVLLKMCPVLQEVRGTTVGCCTLTPLLRTLMWKLLESHVCQIQLAFQVLLSLFSVWNLAGGVGSPPLQWPASVPNWTLLPAALMVALSPPPPPPPPPPWKSRLLQLLLINLYTLQPPTTYITLPNLKERAPLTRCIYACWKFQGNFQLFCRGGTTSPHKRHTQSLMLVTSHSSWASLQNG